MESSVCDDALAVDSRNEAALLRDLSPASAALLVIDMQIDFLSPRGRLPIDQSRVDVLIRHVNSAIARCTAKGILVLHIGNEFKRFDIGNLFRGFAAIQGSVGSAIDPRVTSKGCAYFSKHCANAFSNSELGNLLSKRAIRTVLLAGVYTNGCVIATARGAIRQGYHVVILEDCVASRSDRSSRRALEAMRADGALISPTLLI
jgi:nicotinamidase-related amidase